MEAKFLLSPNWYFYLEVGNWFFSIFFNPKVWAIDWHRKAPCCKFWVVIGPFEINRIWTDTDDYPFDENNV